MTGTALKLLALVLMVMDHIGEFIPGMPIWLRWLGRLSLPLFFYIAMWGFQYTRNRKTYLIRLYWFGVGMTLMNLVLNLLFQNPYMPIINNIFVTIFLSCILVALIEQIRKDRKVGLKYLAWFVLLQVASTVLCVLAINLPIPMPMNTVGALLPNILFNEGSFLFIGLGVLLYYIKDSKKRLVIGYGACCLLFFMLECSMVGITGWTIHTLESLLFNFFQWMMVFSLPFMLLYNGKKGKGFKYLFYMFYPLHIAVLFLIGNLCF